MQCYAGEGGGVFKECKHPVIVKISNKTYIYNKHV